MSNLLKLLKHPTFTLADDLESICRPLKDLGIDSFSHLKSDKNNNFSFLATNPKFIEHYFNKKYFNNDIHTCDLKHFGNYVIWDLLPRTGGTLEMEKEVAQFGVKHTFTIIQRGATENNFYHFSSSKESKTINQVYLSNLDLLTLFINQFNKITAASKELSAGYKLEFTVDSDSPGFCMEEKEIILEKNNFATFSAKLNIPSLSTREMECLAYSVRGKSAKETAHILGLSHRTVETHLERAKIKFGARTKSQLIEKWFEIYQLENI